LVEQAFKACVAGEGNVECGNEIGDLDPAQREWKDAGRDAEASLYRQQEVQGAPSAGKR